jgi:hypothetical protein
MYPAYNDILALRENNLRPDRRPVARDSEIRLRVKRLTRAGR